MGSACKPHFFHKKFKFDIFQWLCNLSVLSALCFEQNKETEFVHHFWSLKTLGVKVWKYCRWYQESARSSSSRGPGSEENDMLTFCISSIDAETL